MPSRNSKLTNTKEITFRITSSLRTYICRVRKYECPTIIGIARAENE